MQNTGKGKCDRNMKMLRVVDVRKKERKKEKEKYCTASEYLLSEFQWEGKLTPSMQKCFDEKGFFVAK